MTFLILPGMSRENMLYRNISKAIRRGCDSFWIYAEARVKSSFPWQVVKTSLTGLRIEVIKILEAA